MGVLYSVWKQREGVLGKMYNSKVAEFMLSFRTLGISVRGKFTLWVLGLSHGRNVEPHRE